MFEVGNVSAVKAGAAAQLGEGPTDVSVSPHLSPLLGSGAAVPDLYCMPGMHMPLHDAPALPASHWQRSPFPDL